MTVPAERPHINIFREEQKMKTKKIMGIVLAMIMACAAAFALAGCGDDVDPVELFKKASDNLSAASDLSFDGKLGMEMKAEGQEISMSIDMDGQYIKSTTDDPIDMQMKMHMLMNMLGQKNEMTMYVKDGYTYTDDGTNKTKAKFTKDSAEQMKKLMDTKFEMDKYVTESSMEDDVVKLTIDGKKMMKDAMKKLQDNVGDTGNATIDSYTQMFEKAGIDKVTVEAGIKDENFTSFKMAIPMTIDTGTGTKYDADVDIDFSKIEVNTGAKEVEIPDADKYKEQ
jgi:hypothetical protein